MDVDCIIGIDPGASGGIVSWRPNTNTKAVKMPKDINDIKEYIEYYKEIAKPIVFLEKLTIRPDDITDGNKGKIYRIQKMLQNYEQLKAILTIIGVPFVLVHPMKWQNELRLRKKLEDKADRKKRYKEVASNLYPDVKVTMWNADALLIMHFGRYALVNIPEWVRQNVPTNVYNRIWK